MKRLLIIEDDRAMADGLSITLKSESIDVEKCYDITMEYYKGSTSIDLSKTEQRLLKLLIENRGFTVKREFLVDRLWTDCAEYVDENALSVTVKRLRNKLEDNSANHVHIKTVYGIGYRWQS